MQTAAPRRVAPSYVNETKNLAQAYVSTFSADAGQHRSKRMHARMVTPEALHAAYDAGLEQQAQVSFARLLG